MASQYPPYGYYQAPEEELYPYPSWPSFPQPQHEPVALPQHYHNPESRRNSAPFFNPPPVPPRPRHQQYQTSPPLQSQSQNQWYGPYTPKSQDRPATSQSNPWQPERSPSQNQWYDPYTPQYQDRPASSQSNPWQPEQRGNLNSRSSFGDPGSRTGSPFPRGSPSCWLPDDDSRILQNEPLQDDQYFEPRGIEPVVEENTTAQEAMADASTALDSIKDLEDDIKAATDKIANTLENFKQVRSKLASIDKKELVPEKFAPVWQTLYDKYYNILALSKTHANEIAAFGTHFDKNIRKYGQLTSDTSADERIAMIQNSLIITKKFQTDSETLERQIDDLSSGLCDIAEKLKPELFAKNEQSKVEKDLIDIHVRIEKIKQHIGAVDQEILGVAKKLRASEIGEGIVKCVIPRFGLKLLRAGTRSSQYRKEIEAHGVSREGKQREMDGLELDIITKRKYLQQVDGARVLLADVQGQIADIRDTIKFFAVVWAGIKGRCDEIVLYLQDGNCDSQSLMAKTKLFLEFTKLPQTYYSALGDVLRRFAKGLGNYTSTSALV